MKYLVLSGIMVFSAIGSQVHAGDTDQAAAKKESQHKNQSDETFSFTYDRSDLDSQEGVKALKKRLSSEIQQHCQAMAHYHNGPALSEQQFREACMRVVRNEAFARIEDQSFKFSRFAESTGK